jgi:hypothetical protein
MAHFVTLNWQAPAVGPTPTSYDVFRGTAAGKENATPLATGITATTYVDNDPGLVEGQTYFYYVEAVDAAGASVPSAEANATIPFAIPDAPTGLTAVAT